MAMMRFGQACDAGLAAAMAEDELVLTWGEDVRLLRRELFVRFGADRVLDAPISEAAFVQAGVGAAMGGLRPVVEVMLVDFLATAWSALLNSASKVSAFSGGRWHVPLVVRSACGGGYGDGGQHEQALWGSLSSMPGLKVVVPSTPADAAGLMLAAVRDEDPVVVLEHKLLSEAWLDYMGGSRRTGVRFGVPAGGAKGEVELPVAPLPIGVAALRRSGDDVVLVSVGVGVHRALEAAQILAQSGIEASVLDLRTVAPLDREALVGLARDSGRVVAVDEDYTRGGLTGEIAAVMAEAGVAARFARVAVDGVIPYARDLEEAALPTVHRIVEAARRLE
jgi:acetoin:2,6-dichlorophenolindophenol oxidoreductase subunit beta